MKKTLGFLFGLYFFVIQVMLIGWMFQLSRLYTLALINLIMLLIFSLLARRKEEKKHDKHPHEHKDEHKEESKKAHHHDNKEAVAPAYVYEAAGKKKAGNSSLIPFVLSLIIAVVGYGLSNGAAFGLRMVLISLIAGIVFGVLTILWKAQSKWFNKLFGTRLYRVLMILGLLIFAYQYFWQTQSFFTYLRQEMINIHLAGGEDSGSGDQQEAFYLKQEGTVLERWDATWESSTAQLDEILSGEKAWDAPSVSTGKVEETAPVAVSSEPETIPTTLPSRVGTSQRMIDVVKYLISTYSIPLVSKKDVRFSNVSTTSPDYPYMRTAYAQKLIWSSTSTTKLMLCDTYIVMKGILEKWDVSYSKANVMQKYRDYAQTNNKLNGCEKGKVVKTGNL